MNVARWLAIIMMAVGYFWLVSAATIIVIMIGTTVGTILTARGLDGPGWKMATIGLLILVLTLVAGTAMSQPVSQQTIRDPQGRVVGREIMERNGTTRFVDPQGRTTMREIPQANGTTRFVDPQGRTVATRSR